MASIAPSPPLPVVANDDEHPSLEYIEDSYLPSIPATSTPSLDEPHIDFDNRLLFDDDYDADGLGEATQKWSAETELFLRQMPLDQIFCISDEHPDDMLKVEADLGDDEEGRTVSIEEGTGNRTGSVAAVPVNRLERTRMFVRKLFTTKKSMRDVRVTFIDLSKPYLAKISSSDNYKSFLNIGDGSEKLSDHSPGAASVTSFESTEFANDFAGLSFDEQERLRAEWSQELSRVEEEIATLRTVLTSKMRLAAELKRKLGITVWKEISDDMNQGIKTVRESTVYQKTASAISTTAEKTTSIFGGLTSGISSKLTAMKKSDSYRSLEERVDSAYNNVKTKVVSRSGSVDDGSSHLDSRGTTAPQSPTIPEGHALP